MPLHNADKPAATEAWLTIVGIGEDGIPGLPPASRDAIGKAEIVMGGKRHLALAADLIKGEARAWPEPFDSSLRELLSMRGRNVCVLASGDPFHYGVGTTISRAIPSGEIKTLPAPSAFSLAASRLGWSLQDTDLVSLHGRPVERIRPFLQHGNRILALTSDGNAPAIIGRYLRDLGFGGSLIHVLEALGGSSEKRTVWTANDELPAFHPLNVLAIEVTASGEATVVPIGFGLPDDLFDHDGQITKRIVRSATLSALSPRRTEMLWDIGSGSGSVAIEWLLAHPSTSAIAFEKDATRAARITRNAKAFGLQNISVVEGVVPHTLADLPSPDAIFVGGGGSENGVMDKAIDALKPGGRIVANSVTLEMEAVLLALHDKLGGELVQLAVARAAGIGSMRGWKPAMPIVQWSWVKP